MSLTESDIERVMSDYHHRLTKVRIKRSDGSVEESWLPIGSIDYIELGALDRILRHLGYTVAARSNDDIDATIRIEALGDR